MTTVVLALIAVGLFIRVLVGYTKMSRVLAAPPPTPLASRRVYPSITVIRPIKGMDVGVRENTAALLAQDYPGEVQTLFVFDSPSDPAYPLVSAMAAESGKDARVVFAGARPVRRTGKLNAMIHAFAQARGELVAFCDSDARPTPELLRELVDELLDRPDAGATFAPAVTAGTPSSFAEVVYGLMINSWYGAAAAEMAGEKRELPFIMGQVMVLRRDALSAIGGLESAEGQLVDDMFLGAQLSAKGFKNVMVRSPLHLVTGPLGLHELTVLLRKWMTFSRSGLPAEFVQRNFMRGLDLALALGTTATALLLGKPVLALLSAAGLGMWIFGQASLYRRFSGSHIPLRFAFWVPVVAPFLAGILLATSRFTRTVEWRGQSYQLNGAARLDSAPSTLSATAGARSVALTAAPPRNLTVPPRGGRGAAPARHRQRLSVH